MSLFTNGIILYVANPKDTIKNYWSSSMNFVKLQDAKLIYRNLCHFYTLTTNYSKDKL